MAEQNSRFDSDTFDNTSSVPNQAGVGDNIDFDESLPANDKETSSIITDDEDDEAAEDAREDTV
ncbi:MAG TPA: hypothetical protein VEQ34_03180 [Pyrinomonadaceae bacterium]|nr:hypothetical protein [Pyrinomonadaceae bacterium]